MSKPTESDRRYARGIYRLARETAVHNRDDAIEVIAGIVAGLRATERAEARAPFLTLADEMESDGKGDSGYMEYHEGFNAALVNAAKSIRAAAQDTP